MTPSQQRRAVQAAEARDRLNKSLSQTAQEQERSPAAQQASDESLRRELIEDSRL